MYLQQNDQHASHANRMANACGDKLPSKKELTVVRCSSPPTKTWNRLAAIMLAINDSQQYQQDREAKVSKRRGVSIGTAKHVELFAVMARLIDDAKLEICAKTEVVNQG